MHDDRSERARRLRRVAEALGEPVAALFETNDDIGAKAVPTAAETNALLAAFALVASPQARRRIISAVEAEARRFGAAPGRSP